MISAENVTSGNYNLEIFDISGKVVYSENIWVADDFSRSIATDFESGIYTLTLSNNSTILTNKFIVK